MCIFRGTNYHASFARVDVYFNTYLIPTVLAQDYILAYDNNVCFTVYILSLVIQARYY